MATSKFSQSNSVVRTNRRKLAAAVTLAVAAIASNATNVASALDLPSASAYQEGVPQLLYLSVRLNEMPVNGIFPFTVIGSRVLADRETLIKLGFKPDALPAMMGDIDIGGMAFVSYDQATQSVSIRAPITSLNVKTTSFGEQGARYVSTPSATMPGALLNYNLTANRYGNQTIGGLQYGVRGFGLGNAVIESTGYVQFGNAMQGSRHRRLDTTARWDWAEKALRFEVGDIISGGQNDWARSVRMGGIRVGTNYSALQPGRLLAPLPTFTGTAAVPSNVELYVNGMKQYTQDVLAGPYSVTGLPTNNGTGQATLIVTDVLGQRQELDIPFYYSSALLQKGVSQWSASAGVLRDGYGLGTGEYGSSPAAQFSFRRGMSSVWTLESNAEGTSGLRNVGLGSQFIASRIGVFALSAAVSSSDAGSGNQWSAAYQWNNSRLFAQVRHQQASENYRDIASMSAIGSLMSVSQNANVGVQSLRFGSLSMNYARLQYHKQPMQRMAGLNWSHRFNNGLNLFASYNADLDNDRRSTSYIGMSIPLGSRGIQATANVQRNYNGDLSTVAGLYRNSPTVHGLSWRTQVSRDDDDFGGLIGGSYQFEKVRVSAEAQRMMDQSRYNANISGTVAFTAGGVSALRTVSDGFALVRTGVAGVPVWVNNHQVGHTNRRGDLFVSDLQAMFPNSIRIGTRQLSADMLVASDTLRVAPLPGVGTVAKFDIRRVNTAIVEILLADGTPVPVGSIMRWSNDQGTSMVVGYDGLVYFEDLPATDRTAIIELDAGTCSVVVTPKYNGVPLRCSPLASPSAGAAQ